MPSPPAIAPDLQQLLPAPIAADPLLRAGAQAVQPALDAVQPLVQVPALWSHLDTLPAPVLDMLAWESGVMGAEWALAQTLEEKRNLLRASFELNQRRGTRWAIERVFSILRMRAVIKEWWEESPTALPWTFRIAILDVAGRGILDSELGLVDELIAAYKPMTRHNAGINLANTSDATACAAGAASITVRVVQHPAPVMDPEIDFTRWAAAAATITLRIVHLSPEAKATAALSFGGGVSTHWRVLTG